MNVKKDDILYRYKWVDISDKDYCTDKFIDTFNKRGCKDLSGLECPIYNKCLVQPQKIVLTKVKMTKRTLSSWDKSKVMHYNCIDVKYCDKKRVPNFRNNDFEIKEKIYPRELDEWSKTESTALLKVNKRLKDYIKIVKKAKEDDYYGFRDKRLLQRFIDLQTKIEIKIKANK